MTSNEYNRSRGTILNEDISPMSWNGEKHEIIEAAIFRVVENRLEIQEKKSLINKRPAAIAMLFLTY